MKVINHIPIRYIVSSISYDVKFTHAAGTAAAAEAACMSTLFVIAEKSLRRLWALKDNVAFESSARVDIHVVGSS